MDKQNTLPLLQAARNALADLEGIMPEFEPSGDRLHPGWHTVEELKQSIAAAAGLASLLDQSLTSDGAACFRNPKHYPARIAEINRLIRAAITQTTGGFSHVHA